jgi:hypothetical protein
MTKLFSYSISLTPPAPPKPELQEYAYSEFMLALPLHWKQLPTSTDNTFNFQSELIGAGITVSVDFYDIPESKAQAFAEKNLSSRLEALEQITPGQVQVLLRSIKPHSGGVGLELGFVAEVPNEHVYMYLGYVTSRKILNFTLVCRPGKEAAAALFNEIVPHFQLRFP